MKGIFEIEWPDDYGPGWMNQWNLETCLRTKEFIGPKVEISVKDITAVEAPPPNPPGSLGSALLESEIKEEVNGTKNKNSS
jgi:hypothetical protein